MLDVNNLKPGQMVRYSSKMYNSAESVESLWILLEEELGAQPLGRAFKLYQIYDSENCIDLGDSTVSYTFDQRNAKDFTLEVA
jgi:hypothetical protein